MLPGNSGEFRAAMDKLYDDEGYAKKLGVAARERFDELFTGSRMGKQYDELYQALMNNK